MYERSYGSKITPGDKYLRAAEIAKLMRADIKALVGEGKLPGAMANYSVRSESYSGGRSIRIEARDLDGMYMQCPGHKHDDRLGIVSCRDPWCKAGGEHQDSEHARYHDILTKEGERVLGILKGIHWSYNYDGSEVQVDYFDRNFYGDASIETERERQFRLSEKERMAKRKAAKLAKASA